MLTFGYGTKTPSQAPQATLFQMEMKDPSRPQLGNNGMIQIVVNGAVQAGPENSDIKTVGMEAKILANPNGDFIYDLSTPDCFDASNAFANVARTLDLYRRVLNQLGHTQPLYWQWGNEAIACHPHAGVTENAEYVREQKCLKFYYFQSQSGAREWIYTCRAQDVVAHEAGHAILDSLKPGFLNSYLPQTGALHEAFGDLTSIFVLLDDPQCCEEVIIKSKGNLLKKDLFLPTLANQFGSAIGLHHGLRNANNDLKLSQVGQEVHGLSQVFTGALYGILAKMFTLNFNQRYMQYSRSQVLAQTGNELLKMLIQALKASPEKNVSFADVANYLITFAPNHDVKGFIRDEFTSREVDLKKDYKEAPIVTMHKADYSKCSGTLKHPSHVKMRTDALTQREAELKAREQSWVRMPKVFG